MSGKIGPGKPLVSGRIRKGEVRNPKGRPRTQRERKSVSAFDVVIDKILTVTRSGQPREITVEEALQHRMYQDALAGNRPARREILKMIARREKFLVSRHKPKRQPVESRIEDDPANAHEALLLLDITSRAEPWGNDDEYERLLLEPWAVQLALGRRKGGTRLTGKEISEIRRCTSDPETIRWPRGTPDD